MELVAGLDTQIFVIFLGVVVALGCTLVAFLVDFLKGKNERLREQVLEMTVRQEERARLPQAQMDSVAVISAIAQVGKNLELVVRSAMSPAAVLEAPIVEAPAAAEPVFQTRRAANMEFAAIKPETPAAEPVIAAESALAPQPVVEPVPEETIAAEHLTAAAMVAPTLFEEPVAIPAPAAEITSTETPAVEIATPEPDWRIASWHEETVAQADAPPKEHLLQQPVPEIPVPEIRIAEIPVAEVPVTEVPVAEVPVPEIQVPEIPVPEVLATVEPAPEFTTSEPVVTTNSFRESLRSLFDSPASIAKANQLEMECTIEAPVSDVEVSIELEVPAQPEAEEPAPMAETLEPVVRIRVLSNNVVSSLEEEVEPVLSVPEVEIETSATEVEAPAFAAATEVQEVEAVEEPIAPIAEITVTEEATEEAWEPALVMEDMTVAAPIDFLTAADLGEAVPPAPHESFDSLMAAVNAEPAVAPEETELLPVEPEDPGVLALPSGMNDRATLDFLKRDKALFTGLIVSIGINDYARLQETSGRPAAEELAKSVSQLVKSLIAAPNGTEYFGCRASDDEFIVVFAGENGSVAQRRLNGLSERLWDFQLRSLGNFSVMFSWGATEANGETFADSVEAASERMRETRHNRRTISMEKTRLKKVVNG